MRRAVFFLQVALLWGQDLDTIVGRNERKPASLQDQADSPDERDLYLRIYRETIPVRRRSLATEFLHKFPGSCLLAPVYEAASKASMEMGDLASARFYAAQSLRLYPENPLLLVPLAMLQARRGNTRAASASAQTALEYLNRFVPPAGLPDREWASVRGSLRETAEKILGRPLPVDPPPKPDPAAAYAGSEACRHCHASQYAAWRQTGMQRMLREAKPENIIGDFESENEFRETGQPLAARMSRRNGLFFFDLRRAGGQWDRFRVDFTIGSKWQQAYATQKPSGDLQVLPIQYNRLEKKWVNYWKSIDPPASERTDTGRFHEFRGVTSYQRNCAPCHTSQLRPSGFAEPGVNCEMCHGPSADHAAGGAPRFRFRDIGNRAYVEVCAQCHAQSALRDPQGFPPRYERRPYIEFSPRAFYRDGRFRETTFIVESFERSACFRKGQAHCGSCHDPHPPGAAVNPTSLKFPGNPDRMCLQCHPASYAAGRHTKHPAQSEAARCVSCHMPKIMNSLLFRARSHQIDDRPDASMTERFGMRESPNACQICHPERATQWTREQLRSW